IDGVTVDDVHSNIVFVDLDGPARPKADGLLAHLERHGILATGLYRMRFVTHLGITDADVDTVCEVATDYLGQR
ncbi:MAG: hypothetical protein ACRCY9_23355, partial [Phycicoccus sp.]